MAEDETDAAQVSSMKAIPPLKLCNCGACGVTIRAENVRRRIAVGERNVPLCFECGSKPDAEVVALVEWMAKRVAG